MDTRLITKGDLLIADPFLKDKAFSRAVVLLCENDTTGSVGFILNKTIPQKLGDLLQEMDGSKYPVYYGGPVRTNILHFIHTRPDLIPDGYPITEQLYWGGDFDIAMKAVQEYHVSPNDLRIFLGQSGWAENQLKHEINEKTWLTGRANRHLIFEEDTNNIWKEAIKTLDKKYLEVINYPLDPNLN